MRLKNKISVITGGSRGIGAATVKRFVEEGSKVYIFDILDSEGTELANQLEKENFFVKFMKVNIKNEDEIKKAFLSIKLYICNTLFFFNLIIIYFVAKYSIFH